MSGGICPFDPKGLMLPIACHQDNNKTLAALRKGGLDAFLKAKDDQRLYYHVVLTGGPCAGKSTFLDNLVRDLRKDIGVKVYCVPEACTILIVGGFERDENTNMQMQMSLMDTVLGLEKQFLNVAKVAGKKAIIVSDRGGLDASAYCTAEAFEEVLRRTGWSRGSMRDRYDAVLHFVTAADGAPKHYNLDNPARFEDHNGAILCDGRLQKVYLGHHQLHVVDNSGPDFNAKLAKGRSLLEHVIKARGGSDTSSHGRVYPVKKCPAIDQFPLHAERVSSRLTVLKGADSRVRLAIKREQPQHSSCVFLLQQNFPSFSNPNVDEYRLMREEYSELRNQHSAKHHGDVLIESMNFLYKNQVFELCYVTCPNGKQCQYLKVVVEGNAEVSIPGFVTVDSAYSTEAEHLRKLKKLATALKASI